MGIYLCDGCNNLKDDDYSGCFEGGDGVYCDTCVEESGKFDEEGEWILGYKDWIIEYNPKPIPTTDYDWDAYHKDYDGAEDSGDNRCIAASSYEHCIRSIKEIEEGL